MSVSGKINLLLEQNFINLLNAYGNKILMACGIRKVGGLFLFFNKTIWSMLNTDKNRRSNATPTASHFGRNESIG